MAQFAGSDRIGRTCQYSRTPGKDRSWVVQEEGSLHSSPNEVSSQQFSREPLYRSIKLLGIRELHSKIAIRHITDAAEKTPRLLWTKRVNPQATFIQVGTGYP